MSHQLPDFDTMLELAENNPHELEDIRKAAIEALISSAPVEMQRRLRGLQFQIDAHCSIANNPMASCIKISEMMHQSFHKLRWALNQATGQDPQTPYYYEEEEESFPQAADVIPFRT